MLGLLKYILIIYLIYYLISKVGKSLLKNFMGTPNQGTYNQKYNSYRSTSDQSEKGKISVLKKKSDQQSKDDFRGGEYVEYEEVE